MVGTDNQVEPMQPIVHRYPRYVRVFCLLFNCAAFVLPIYLLSAIFSAGSDAPLHWLALVVVMAVYIGGTLLFTANYFPSILTDEDGMQIKFLYWNLYVPWEEVVALESVRYFGVSTKTHWVVITRTLPLFHRLYGLMYARTIRPCFTFNHSISDYKRLLRRITLHLKRNRE